jgi:hypothetical protein
MSRATETKHFEVQAWRKNWGHHKEIIEASSADEAIEKYKEIATNFPIEWIAEVKVL